MEAAQLTSEVRCWHQSRIAESDKFKADCSHNGHEIRFKFIVHGRSPNFWEQFSILRFERTMSVITIFQHQISCVAHHASEVECHRQFQHQISCVAHHASENFHSGVACGV